MDSQQRSDQEKEFMKIEISAKVLQLYKRQIDPGWSEEENAVLERDWAALLAEFPEHKDALRVLSQRLQRAHQSTILFPDLRPMMKQLLTNEGIVSDPVTMDFVSDIGMANVTTMRGEFDAPFMWVIAESMRISEYMKQSSWGRFTFNGVMQGVFSGVLTDAEANFRFGDRSSSQ